MTARPWLSPLNQLLVEHANGNVVMRVMRNGQLLLERPFTGLMPQGGTGGVDEITEAEIRRLFGPGRYRVEVTDAPNPPPHDDLSMLYAHIHDAQRRVHSFIELEIQ